MKTKNSSDTAIEIDLKHQYFKKIVNQKWWTFFEAAFVLAGCPQEQVFLTSLAPAGLIPDYLLAEKQSFLLPNPLPFNPKNHGEEFENIFNALTKEINDNPRLVRKGVMHENFFNLIKPFNAIMWAIENKNILPKNLQEALGIIQNIKKHLNPWRKRVHNMIVAQYYMISHPEAKLKDLINGNNKWVKTTIDGMKIDQNYSIDKLRHDCSSTSIIKKGKPGRGKNDDENPSNYCKISIKCIPEVLERRQMLNYCNFYLLETVISTVVLLKIEYEGLCSFRKVEFDEFIRVMRGDEIIKLYLEHIHPLIETFIEDIIKKQYGKISDKFYWGTYLKILTRLN